MPALPANIATPPPAVRLVGKPQVAMAVLPSRLPSPLPGGYAHRVGRTQVDVPDISEPGVEVAHIGQPGAERASSTAVVPRRTPTAGPRLPCPDTAARYPRLATLGVDSP